MTAFCLRNSFCFHTLNGVWFYIFPSARLPRKFGGTAGAYENVPDT